MEQHPVPRNITGFQFHLIGDMTLKQFGELLGGFILGYITIKLPLPTIVSWPLGACFALSGVAFAFIPIQERPLDRWLVAFLRSVYSPTQFLWQKQNEPPTVMVQVSRAKKQQVAPMKHLTQLQESRQKLDAYLATLPKHPHETIDQNERAKLAQLNALFAKSPNLSKQIPAQRMPSPPPIRTTAPAPKPSHQIPAAYPNPVMPWEIDKPASPPTPKTTSMSSIATSVQQQLVSPPPSQPRPIPIPPAPQQETIDKEIAAVKTELADAQISPDRSLELEKQLAQLAQEREQLANELAALKRNMLSQTPPPAPPAPSNTNVKIIRPEDASKAGLPSIPNIPNMISGMIKDRAGNLLQNIIITVKDKDGTPQRALKSNRLGQFAASTPLTNGEYTIEMEDPQKKYVFDTIRIHLTGELTTPIEVLAKSEKEVNRERLMKEVFGT